MPALLCFTSERTVLKPLRGHCNSPIAEYARAFEAGRLALRTMVFTPDGANRTDRQPHQRPAHPQALGEAAAEALIRGGAHALIDAIAH
ncbi:hypothetical protein [Streptomyces albogriseolus]|uniref:hypothetical protein n=1 Tax=Streptomyces albogriseolus TaxID=1887 RepID=UPI002252AF69|nr:hypothetical protein [Streptomyces viridodiastaticus]MCX4624433.1 hypothetical protein [Streptomyces viridodiastaticus]